jgi:hypothetical protein
MIAELQDVLRDHEKAAKGYWCQPVSRLAEALQRNEPQEYRGVEFTKTTEPRPSEGKEAFLESYEIINRQGHVLSPAAQQKYLIFAVHQCLTQCADLTDVNNYILCFRKMLEWGAFTDAEYGFDESQVQYTPEPVQQEQKLSIDDIDTSTRAGQKIAAQLISDEVFGPNGQARETWDLWLAHLQRDHNFTPDEKQRRAIIEFFRARNLSFLSHEAYNAARRWATRHTVEGWPSGMLSTDEHLCEKIDASSNLNNYETRTNLLRDIRTARNQ